jgi:hypothetical protein
MEVGRLLIFKGSPNGNMIWIASLWSRRRAFIQSGFPRNAFSAIQTKY